MKNIKRLYSYILLLVITIVNSSDICKASQNDYNADSSNYMSDVSNDSSYCIDEKVDGDETIVTFPSKDFIKNTCNELGLEHFARRTELVNRLYGKNGKISLDKLSDIVENSFEIYIDYYAGHNVFPRSLLELMRSGSRPSLYQELLKNNPRVYESLLQDRPELKIQ